MKIRRITTMALLCAIALTIHMVEAQIPPIVPLPGVKIGLANIVTVFAVFALGPGDAAMILTGRIFLGAVFAGNFSSILYSAAGGACAILVTILLRGLVTKKQLWAAGSLGAVAHSIGQVATASLLMGSAGVLVYLPVLMAVSVVTGFCTGLCAQFLVNRGNLVWATSSK